MNRPLAARLARMRQRDTDTRQRLLAQGRLYGRYDEAMQRVHIENAEALSRIIARHGWPGVAMVGVDGCRDAWLIAQHAICSPRLQRGFLRALREAADAGEAPKSQWAYLLDRIRFNEGRPQIYGTVLDWNRQGRLDCEVEARQELEQRRAAVGLPPFAEELARQRAAAAQEGAAPPPDYDAYKKAADEWAANAGWRDGCEK